MSGNKRKLKLFAHEARFISDSKFSFQEIIAKIDEKNLDNEEKTYSSESSEVTNLTISGFLNHPSNEGMAIILTIVEKGKKMPTVDYATSNKETHFGSTPAGKGKEFLDNKIILFAVNNTVISCGLANRQRLVCSGIFDIAKRHGIVEGSEIFNLSSVPNLDYYKRIKEYGVAEVEFNGNFMFGLLGQSATDSLLNRIFGSSDTSATIKKKRENVLKIVIKNRFLGRKKIGTEVATDNNWIKDVALAVMDQDDSQYRIRLNNGDIIKHGQLFEHREVEVESQESSYDHNEAHKMMVSYYQDILKA
jgi:hypothetical protein